MVKGVARYQVPKKRSDRLKLITQSVFFVVVVGGGGLGVFLFNIIGQTKLCRALAISRIGKKHSRYITCLVDWHFW